MAGVAAIVSAFEPHRPDSGQQVAGTLFAVARALSTFARHSGRNRPGFLEQMFKSACAGPVHGGASSRFDGFQIEAAASAQPGKHDIHQLFYFAGDFLLDRFGRFFSCGVRLFSSGRNRQIFSLTSMKSRWIC
jgi:hypothetical protein